MVRYINSKCKSYAYLFSESSHLVLGLPIPPIPTTSLPVFRGPRPQYEGFPQFVSQNQEVDALEGSTAILECTLVNLASHHTVII